MTARNQPVDAFLSVFCDDGGHRRGFYRFGGRIYAKGFDLDIETRSMSQLGKPEAMLSKALVGTLR